MALAGKNKIMVFFAVLTLLLLIPGLSEARLSSEDAKAVWSRVAKATELTDLPFTVKQETIPNAWVANGSSVIGVRGSTCVSVFIVGAGTPGGVRVPWAKTEPAQRAAARNLAEIRRFMARVPFGFIARNSPRGGPPRRTSQVHRCRQRSARRCRPRPGTR